MPKLLSHTDYSLTFEIAEGDLVVTIHTGSQVSQRLVEDMYKGVFDTKRYHRSYISTVIEQVKQKYTQNYHDYTMGWVVGK